MMGLLAGTLGVIGGVLALGSKEDDRFANGRPDPTVPRDNVPRSSGDRRGMTI